MATPGPDPLFTESVPLDLDEWTDLGDLVPPGETRFILAVGSGTVDDFGTPRAVTPDGTDPTIPIPGEYGVYGFWAAQVGQDVTSYCLAIAVQAATLTNERDLEPTGLRAIFCPGNGVMFEFTNDQAVAVKVFAMLNGLGDYYNGYTGAFTVSVYPALPETPILTATGMLSGNVPVIRLDIA